MHNFEINGKVDFLPTCISLTGAEVEPQSRDPACHCPMRLTRSSKKCCVEWRTVCTNFGNITVCQTIWQQKTVKPGQIEGVPMTV
jgi:hypothetical protein